MTVTPDRPIATIVLIPGGAGRVTFHRDGTTSYRGFPVRAPELFARRGFLTAVVNAPSDPGLDPGKHFRRDTAEHAADVGHVLALLRKHAEVPVWLVGHSAGSTSAANAAIRLRTGGPDGIVLISSENGKPDHRSGYLDALRVDEITVPTLVVHHEDDACDYTLFRNVPRLMRRLNPAIRSEVISFTGGGPVEGNPCGSLHYHGFPGLEAAVAARIGDWIAADPRR
jgi:pimeloyl-ACP methyl ester carboxylesterase